MLKSEKTSSRHDFFSQIGQPCYRAPNFFSVFLVAAAQTWHTERLFCGLNFYLLFVNQVTWFLHLRVSSDCHREL